MITKCPFCQKEINVSFEYYNTNKCPHCKSKNENINRKIYNIRFIFRLMPVVFLFILSSFTMLNEVICFALGLVIALIAEYLFYILLRESLYEKEMDTLS